MKASVKYTSHTGLLLVIFLAILTIAYLITLNHNRVWDLTAGDENTLDAKTTGILDAIDFEVMVRLFEARSQSDSAENLLEIFNLDNPNIRYEIIDPDANPAKAREYGIQDYGQAVIEARGRSITSEGLDEEGLVNALLRLRRDRQKVVYFITGHGERALEDTGREGLSTLGDALGKDNHETRPLLLLREDAVPQDADLVVVAGPSTPYFAEERAALADYLDKGGAVLCTLEPGIDAGLSGILAANGIAAGDDIIIDTFSRMFGGDYTIPVVVSYNDVGKLKGFSLATFFPTARSLSPQENPPAGITVQWLARTSGQSWSEHDLLQLREKGQAALDQGDVPGPLDIALLASRTVDDETSASLMVFGDTDFLTNTYLMVSGNRELALNCINLLLDEGALITIERQPPRERPFVLTPAQTRMVFWVPSVVVPSLILLVAVLVFRGRRRT